MLTSLDIQNVVLIDRLSLEGDAGLVALTGETGAGKSILLDALGLALGARAEAGLVRHGAAQASVTACFDIPAAHAARMLLKDKGIEAQDGLILRRTLGKDGRSKAFINDAPVSVQLLKETGALLIEIHGQFETQGLLDPATHLETLDTYAGVDTSAIRKLWDAFRAAKDKLEDAQNNIAATKLQEEYLKFTVAELEKLDPKPGEDAVLAEKRHFLMNREKMASTFEDATDTIESEDGLRALIGRLQASFDKLAGKGNTTVTPLLETLSRMQGDVDDLSWQIEKISGTGKGEGNLEEIENRYFALRECARKHRCSTDDLPQVFADLSQRLRLITHEEDTLAELKEAVTAAREKFIMLAQKASSQRQKAAAKLAKTVNAELPDLKLDKAKFFVVADAADDDAQWSPTGIDRVHFAVSTNPQTPAGPLHKIASGGELSRLMLAIKVVLAETGTVPTLIFDEVDSGIGGATADAVGEKLQRLSQKYQVLVVTHSPQVAARAKHHWHVAKTGQKGTVVTRIIPLTEIQARQEEIARMLSGAEITIEARAQAARLLKNNAA